jgi:predicted transcriptional regulator
MAELGLSHSTAYYVLRKLHESGAVEKHVLGGVAYWCVPGKGPADCNVKLRMYLLKGLCTSLNGARGGVITVNVAELLRVAGYDVKAPSVLAAAVKLFETFNVLLRKKRKRQYVYFIVDVAKARSLCPPPA